MIEHETQLLKDLLLSPGWLLFAEYARQEWREHYPEKVKLARLNAKRDGEDAGVAMDRVDAAADAINQLLSWPRERIATLDAKAEREAAPPSVSRRGALS